MTKTTKKTEDSVKYSFAVVEKKSESCLPHQKNEYNESCKAMTISTSENQFWGRKNSVAVKIENIDKVADLVAHSSRMFLLKYRHSVVFR